jgi:hypothetical protein
MSKVVWLAVLLASVPGFASAQPATMANPAAVFCIQHGGTLVPAKDPQGGEHAFCQLSDGRRIEEWRLFRCSHTETAPAEQPPCQDEAVPLSKRDSAPR